MVCSMLKCSTCGEMKDESEFYKSSKTRGYYYRCKECQRKRRRKYYKEHRDLELARAIEYRRTHERDLAKERKWSRNRRKRIRLEVLKHYGGDPPKCACCGESIIEFLSIDHIYGGGNQHRKKIFGRKGRAGFSFYCWLKRNGFPEGFQVLCYNCNCAKAYCGICPHQLDS